MTALQGLSGQMSDSCVLRTGSGGRVLLDHLDGCTRRLESLGRMRLGPSSFPRSGAPRLVSPAEAISLQHTSGAVQGPHPVQVGQNEPGSAVTLPRTALSHDAVVGQTGRPSQRRRWVGHHYGWTVCMPQE